jgi:hypothetical protein
MDHWQLFIEHQHSLQGDSNSARVSIHLFIYKDFWILTFAGGDSIEMSLLSAHVAIETLKEGQRTALQLPVMSVDEPKRSVK